MVVVCHMLAVDGEVTFRVNCNPCTLEVEKCEKNVHSCPYRLCDWSNFGAGMIRVRTIEWEIYRIEGRISVWHEGSGSKRFVVHLGNIRFDGTTQACLCRPSSGRRKFWQLASDLVP